MFAHLSVARDAMLASLFIPQQACYCNGGVSAWSAQRVLSVDPSADVADPVRTAREGRPVQLTAEMVFPFIFDDIVALRPLKARPFRSPLPSPRTHPSPVPLSFCHPRKHCVFE